MVKNKKNQKGFTLIELIVVIAIMAVMQVAWAYKKQEEARQANAQVLGSELAIFSKGLQSYVGFYSGAESEVGAPADGDIIEGVNFLKSNECSSSETSSTGEVDIGFVSDCTFLSNFNDATKDEKTSVGFLGFTTTFARTPNDDGTGTILTATTVVTPLENKDGQVYMTESAIAAIVTGGMTQGYNGAQGLAGYKSVFCSVESGGGVAYDEMCAGNTGSIVVRTTTDATSDLWLRVDGMNTMNNAITYNESINTAMRAIKNLNRVLLPTTGANAEDQALSIEHDDKIMVNIDKDQMEMLDTNLELAGTSFAHAENYIKSDSAVVSKKGMQADVFLPFLGDGNENSTVSNYKVDIDGNSEMGRIGAKGLYFGNTAGARATDGTPKVSSISSKNDTELELKTNTLNLDTVNDANDNKVNISGRANVRNLNLKLVDGTYKSLSDILPRLTLLGTTKVNGDGTAKVQKSTFTQLGCEQNDLRPILIPQGINMQGFFDPGVWMGLHIEGAGSDAYVYGAKDYKQTMVFSDAIAYVKDNGSYWTPIVDGQTPISGGTNPQRNNAATRYGTGILNVYCYNDVE